MAQAKSLVDKSEKAQIEDVKRQLATCDADLEKMRRAVDAFDDATYKKGFAVMAIAATILIVVLISVARVQ
jgi:hypothetical protein